VAAAVATVAVAVAVAAVVAAAATVVVAVAVAAVVAAGPATTKNPMDGVRRWKLPAHAGGQAFPRNGYVYTARVTSRAITDARAHACAGAVLEDIATRLALVFPDRA
jgi:hypothetical protein